MVRWCARNVNEAVFFIQIDLTDGLDPDSALVAYLSVIKSYPDAVLRALEAIV